MRALISARSFLIYAMNGRRASASREDKSTKQYEALQALWKKPSWREMVVNPKTSVRTDCRSSKFSSSMTLRDWLHRGELNCMYVDHSVFRAALHILITCFLEARKVFGFRQKWQELCGAL